MSDTTPTKDQLTAAMAAGRSGAYAQHFAFGASLFESFEGNPDGSSISGVSAAVADIAIANQQAGGRGDREQEEEKRWDVLRDYLSLIEEERERRATEIREMYGYQFDDASFDEAVAEVTRDRATFEAFANRNGIRGADRARYLELSIALRQTDDPAEKARIRAQMGEISESATRELAQRANERYEAQHSSARQTAEQVRSGELTPQAAVAGAATNEEADAIAANLDDDSYATALEARGFQTAEVERLSQYRSVSASGPSLFADDREPLRARFAEASAGVAPVTAQLSAVLPRETQPQLLGPQIT